jgi:predicted GIY-YIG superfamily endonuclease
MTAAYVYRCYEADGRLGYVGHTVDLRNRLASHRYSTWWAPRIVRVVARVYSSVEIAKAHEMSAIRGERPRWNMQGKWSTRSEWTSEDWADYLLALRSTPTGLSSRLNQARFDRVSQLATEASA